eukprot:364366-Chlamydomonas_euryale.AAC.1
MQPWQPQPSTRLDGQMAAWLSARAVRPAQPEQFRRNITALASLCAVLDQQVNCSQWPTTGQPRTCRCKVGPAAAHQDAAGFGDHGRMIGSSSVTKQLGSWEQTHTGATNRVWQ